MDAGTRVRIAVGILAVCVAVLAVLALVNLLLLDPSAGTGTGTGGGDGPQIGPNPGSGQQDGGTPESPGGGGDGNDGGAKPDPCRALKAGFGGASIATLILSVLLWVIAIWWRQAHKTRVLNAWAIVALVFTLLCGTLMFLWWVITKICNLDVSDLETCREIAHSLRNAFIVLAILSAAFLGYAVFLKLQGGRFLNLWSAAGMLFVYVTMLALVGWLVASYICETEFDEEDLPEDLPDPNDGDGDGGGDNGGDNGDPGSGDPGGGDPGDPGDPGNSGDPGGNPGSPGGQQGGRPGGGGGGGDSTGGSPLVSAPSVSPAWFLTIIGIAALATILVMFLRGRGSRQAILAAGIQANALQTERGDLLAMMARTDLASRSAVIAAYRAFLVWCGVRGVPKALSQTPLEHGRIVVEKLGLPWSGIEGLVRSYHVARLAERNPTRHEKDIALQFSGGLEQLLPQEKSA